MRDGKLGRALLLEILERKHVLVLSAQILDELERVLFYPRLLKLSKLTIDEIREYIEFLAINSVLTVVDEMAITPIRDPNDNHVILTAIAGGAAYLCTLDGDFYDSAIIAFCEQNGIRIITDRDLIAQIRSA
ncbi:MAG TPA: putative toxin-antitoxin system toxin component, PIN family [Bryobacteraceae bacterium]|jgi:putative PIN family toxin of toxin-antitoxin system